MRKRCAILSAFYFDNQTFGEGQVGRAMKDSFEIANETAMEADERVDEVVNERVGEIVNEIILELRILGSGCGV